MREAANRHQTVCVEAWRLANLPVPGDHTANFLLTTKLAHSQMYILLQNPFIDHTECSKQVQNNSMVEKQQVTNMWCTNFAMLFDVLSET